MNMVKEYQLQEIVGRGGMSTVYRAYDRRQERQVAVKLMHESLSGSTKARARFSREVQFVRALQHPAIVPVLDYGDVDGRFFIVMPYLSGGSLREKIKQGPIPYSDCLSLLEQVVPGLEAAHNHRIIHRDIKPHNILLDENGRAFLTDFGVARLNDPERTGETITLIGTPEYIAPEQILGRPVSPQTDVYQMGVTVFQMLTGERPFTGSSIPQQHLNHPVPSARELTRDLPEGIDYVLQRAMAKTQQSRFSSPSDFLNNLAALDGQTAVTAFTPWSLEQLDFAAVQKNEGQTDSMPVPMQTSIGGSRFPRLPRRVLSFTAVCLALVVMTFFSINHGAEVVAAASPLFEQVSEIIPVSDGQVDQFPTESDGTDVVTETVANDNPNTIPRNLNPPPPANGGRDGNPGPNGGVEQNGRRNGPGN